MAALDFPDSPTVGQVFDKWTWNGTMWVLTPGASAGFTFSQDAMPTARKTGDTWFQTSSGQSYVWEDDGNSLQWVQFAPGGSLGAPEMPKGLIAAAGASNTIISATTYTLINSLVVNQVAGRRYVVRCSNQATYATGGTAGSTFTLGLHVDGVLIVGSLIVDTALSGGYIPQSPYFLSYKPTVTKAATWDLRIKRDTASSGTITARYTMEVLDEGAWI